MKRLLGMRQALAGVVALVLCGAAAAQPDDAGISIDVLLAVESSRGHYGDAELTRITTRTATFKLRGALWRLEAELPWLEVRTQGPAGGLPGQATRGGSLERGQGDAWIRLGYQLRGVEGYPGLVVHGPLIATLLMDLLRRQAPGAEVAAFRFKAVRPTFDGHPLRLYGQPVADGRTVRLWAADHEGWLTMDAVATLR